MTSEYIIKKGPGKWEAKIFSDDANEIAEIKRIGGKMGGQSLEFRLSSRIDDRKWLLTNKIDGEHRRFSLSVSELGTSEEKGQEQGLTQKEPLLTVRDNIFKHNGKFYMLGNQPEGISWDSYVNSSIRYISRLQNFPYSDVSEVEENKHHQALRHKLKRFRGVPVGETFGLGSTPQGHHVKVFEELDDIGLFLAATSYLMYASA